MSNNTVRAHVRFSFKGETHDLEAVVDLDRYDDVPPDFHRLLAETAGIDTYSYLYEVLESHEVEFSAPSGIASAYCEGGRFDWEGYAQARRAGDDDWQAVRAVVVPLLGERVDTDGALKAALLAAYRAGKADARQ